MSGTIVDKGRLTRTKVEELCEAIQSGIILPTYNLSEYMLFSTAQLFNDFKSTLIAKSDHGAMYVCVTRAVNELAWAILDKSEYDSSIFGFNVSCLDTVLVSEGFSVGLDQLFQNVKTLAAELQTRYISLSLNTNDPTCPLIMNSASNHGFYYINTLITFGFTRLNFSQLDLNYQWDKEVSVRMSKPDDFKKLYEIAISSYKINRYHLDPHLPKDKCDALYAESLRNSFFHGFVDRIVVADYRGEPIGYFSGRVRLIGDLSARLGTGVISSVSKEHRGMGVFQAMNRYLIQSINADSDLSEWGTYINNYPVHSVYIKSKMRLIRGIIQMGYCDSELGN